MRLDACFLAGLLAAALSPTGAGTAWAQQCSGCHSAEFGLWSASPHANTQLDPAAELRRSHAGATPAEVIQGRDCIACHSPTAVFANGGMNDAQALEYFFTTSNGVFTAATSATNTTAWPHLGCTACHYVAAPHEFIPARLSLFESRTGQYVDMPNSSQLCGQCHGNLRSLDTNQMLYSNWAASRHAHTQTHVASGLGQSWAGQTPHDVIYGTNADNCIACHSPTAVLVRGGDEALALGNFFSTVDGHFTTNTVPVNTGQWPGIGCTACHDPHAPGAVSYYNSTTKSYQTMTNASQLCGQCHGDLRFANTQYKLYNSWSASKHANTQTNVASELSQSHVGQTPEDLIHGPNPDNCIGCHSPTAVPAAGGDEVRALEYFFTTVNGQFTTNSSAAHAAEWPSVACNTCHDPHTPGQLSYFNSATLQYQAMTNSSQLCGQCHGDLRFPNSDHLSYNILRGTGGIGVPDQQLMADVACTDCHMHSSDVPGSNSKSSAGHSWAITVPESGGGSTISCIACHTEATPELVYLVIDGWQTEFQTLEATVSSNVACVAAALRGVQNPAAQAALAEAQHNLAYAQSDESRGFHNHPYLMSLLQAANQKVLAIRLLNAARQGHNVVISWIGSGTLQTAASMNGPWRDVPGATNPLVVAPPAQAQQQYYRLRP